MNYRKLKKVNLEISEISFGCMSLELDQKLADRLLHKAADSGVNYFDTADLYQAGKNEEMVGAALRDRRDKILLATKVGNQLNPDGKGWRWNPSKTYLIEAVEHSLRRLQTDYIDLYQLHGGTIDDPIDEVIETFELLKQQGKIRHYGISSIRPNVIREYIRRSDILSVMLQYSLLDRRPEEILLSLLNEAGIGTMVRGAIAKGLLFKKNSSNYLNYSKEEADLLKDKLYLSSIEERSQIQTMIKWILHNPKVTTAVMGMRNEVQLDEVLGAMSSPDLSPDEHENLGSILTPNRYEQHR